MAGTVSELKRELRSKEVKWVQPEQIHITLRFLGYIWPDEVEGVAEGVNRSVRDTRPFVLRGGRLACFPSVQRPRVLWLGVEEQAESCSELQRRIQRATSGIGEPAEDRGFVPHLTLARITHLERSEVAVLERVGKRPVEISTDWKVSEALLMQSHLSSAGARYEVLHRAPLGLPGEAL